MAVVIEVVVTKEGREVAEGEMDSGHLAMVVQAVGVTEVLDEADGKPAGGEIGNGHLLVSKLYKNCTWIVSSKRGTGENGVG